MTAGNEFKRIIVRFKTERRAYLSLWIFSILFVMSLFAEFISNDRPLLIITPDNYYVPVLKEYAEVDFGGVFETAADYKDPFFFHDFLKRPNHFAIWPINPYSAQSVDYQALIPNPAPPDHRHLLGTDDRGRDILARLIYGFRLSVLFGLCLAVVGTLLGVLFGVIQGYFAGKIDLWLQRIIEVWGSLPELYLLLLFSSFFQPSIFILFILLSLFSWLGLSDYVRAECLKNRNMEYILSARALGLSNWQIIWRHLLPNSLTPVITFFPFRISGAILALTSLDFLGLGVSASMPSLGELLAQGKENLDAWWISLSTFLILTWMLLLLIFIGEGIRHALNSYEKS